MLPTRPLGRTGIDVSVLGLGTVKLGRAVGVKYPFAFTPPDDAQAAALLERAADFGINLIDTAPAYGVAEQRLGQLLAGQRDRWVLCTKAGEAFDLARGESSFDFSPRAVRESVERSLERLRTDRLDIVLLHSDGRDAFVLGESGALEALQRLKDEGKVRAVGASTKTPEGAVLAARRCDVVMLTLNPSERADEGAVEAALETGAGVLVKKALASGHLDRLAPEGRSPIEESLRFVLGRSGVTSVIVGTINPAHLAENAEAAARAVQDSRTPAG